MSRVRFNKTATPPTPAASKGDLFYSSTLSPAALAFVDENGAVGRVCGLTTVDYRLVKVTSILNGTTTYTPTSGVTALLSEAIGGGGAGGGAPSGTAATNFGIGGGGGGGGFAWTWSTTNVAGIHNSIAVGAGGTAGTAGNNPGNNGGNTVFTDNAAATITQGSGGSGGTSSAASATLGGRSVGGAGGLAPTGDRTVQGEDGDWGLCFAPTVAATGAMSGKGGKSGCGFGGGGAAVQTSGAGNNGRVYGGGGSGGIDSAATNRQGGVGANGIIRVWEYA